eukprot:4849451-Amphidinium_carterae.2
MLCEQHQRQKLTHRSDLGNFIACFVTARGLLFDLKSGMNVLLRGAHWKMAFLVEVVLLCLCFLQASGIARPQKPTGHAGRLLSVVARHAGRDSKAKPEASKESLTAKKDVK